jgi:hypothetical protein
MFWTSVQSALLSTWDVGMAQVKWCSCLDELPTPPAHCRAGVDGPFHLLAQSPMFTAIPLFSRR